MKLHIYNEIISSIHACWTRECLQDIAAKFTGVTLNTLVSIYSQETQKKIKKTHYKHHQPDAMELYYRQYLEAVSNEEPGSILIRISQEIGMPYCLLARIILEKYLSHTYCSEDSVTVPKDVIGHMVKDPSLIPDKRLSEEVHQCVISDQDSGPSVDNIKRDVGLEYEKILQEKLRSQKIPFLGEEEMRSQGYDKTPDIKLEVPVAVDGHMVNWIESKASFGDETSHKNYLKDQFWSYWNRFGPGMVVYWFGFIDELDCNREKGILLKDNVPSNIITLTSLVCKE